ncbi:Uu.00g057770.m01.CDS01 [Anthostomella pinea]|uniref:Uu.00g057770.m01.CDS01 n=1 Tax=Anthostomella pinea TaxID=933095 RepID=A0AAI8VRR7_9PEZI|nr:Uu.00g057770.m01.CDS01 [Anthostomella pinea]
MISSTGIDQENHMAHDDSYSNGQWVDMSHYTHMGMAGYPSDYFVPGPSHGLPSDSIGGHMGPPPVPQPLHPNYGNQLPHPIIIPNQAPAHVPWPSLRTNPSHNYSAPPVAIPPVSAPMRQQPRLPTINTSQPRRTLTDEDRRNMCKFHEENPHIKQTEIGLKFGVERSTVSKVLRKKDQYLNQDDRSESPIKRNKGKSPPDIERALANWVRGQQKKGLVVSDYDMQEKAKVFCTGSDSPLKTITASWLEKFKQKHGIGPGKLIRRASETAIPDGSRLDRLDTESPLMSASQTPGGVSPASPAGQASSPQVTSANVKDEEKDTASGFMDFENSAYAHANSLEPPSASSTRTDPPSSTFSGGAFSPTFSYSPDINTGVFGQQANSNFQRPRSQTVPNIEPSLEYINQPQGSEPLTPKYSASGTAPSSALESPAHEMGASSFGLDAAMSPHALHRTSSNSSLAGRSATSGAVSGTMGSSTPNSPTQEDARRAADTLLSFMQNQSTSWVDPSDYVVFVRLTEKLGLNQHQLGGAPKGMSAAHGLGGLWRIPEGDTEMSNSISPSSKHGTAMSG